MKCFICGSENHIDNHHYDCCHGQVSAETVPLCRRCHRTYHDLGLEWFDDEFLDRAIELENRRRAILDKVVTKQKLSPPYPGLPVPYRLRNLTPPFPTVCKEEAMAGRSDYWYEKHGIKPPKVEQKKPSKVEQKKPPKVPLCGAEWLAAHLKDHTIEEIEALGIQVSADGKKAAEIKAGEKKGTIKRRIREALGG